MVSYAGRANQRRAQAMNVTVYSQGRSKTVPLSAMAAHISAILTRSPHADIRITEAKS